MPEQSHTSSWLTVAMVPVKQTTARIAAVHSPTAAWIRHAGRPRRGRGTAIASAGDPGVGGGGGSRWGSPGTGAGRSERVADGHADVADLPHHHLVGAVAVAVLHAQLGRA